MRPIRPPLPLLLLLLLLVCSPPLAAQLSVPLPAGSLYLPHDDCAPASRSPGFGAFADGRATFYNLESFHPLWPGFTLPASRMAAGLGVNVGAWGRLEAGWWIQWLGADRRYLTHAPMLSIQVQPYKPLIITLGTISTHQNQRLPDFLASSPREWIQRPPLGAQIDLRLRFLWLQTWVDWLHFIWRNENNPERFLYMAQAAIPSDIPWGVEPHAVLIARHQGGQIGTASTPVQTLINAALSFRWQTPVIGPGNLKTGIQVWGAFSTNDTLGQYALFPRYGWAFYPALFLHAFDTELTINYFYGRAFMPLSGEPLYAAHSPYIPPQKWLRERRVIAARLLYRRIWNQGLHFIAQAGLFYDTQRKKVDWDFSLSARIRFEYHKPFPNTKPANSK